MDYPQTCASGCESWDNVEQAHRAWLEHERPEWTRLGLTITPEGQRLWIDAPEGTSWPLPP